MKQKQSSSTALGVALVRALEASKPAEQRICFDPLAHHFVPPLLLRLGALMLPLLGHLDPGINEFLVARTRYFDDVVGSGPDRGMQQLVILGAGYDSRAYRLSAARSFKRIFEVDHPATQQAKRTCLRQVGIMPLEHLVYVPIDFMAEELDKLFDYGYQSDVLTLFTWEGVTEYLSTSAVDQTLAFVRRSALPGSVIVFDYIYAEALTTARLRLSIALTRRMRRFTGESLVFGIAEGSVEAFLTERGLSAIANVTHEDLERLYFQGKVPARHVAPIFAIVSVCVKNQQTNTCARGK